MSIRPGRRLHLEDAAHALAELVERVDAEREAHAPLGAELVDQQRMLRALRVLEEERRAAGLHDAVDDLRDLEVGIDLGRHADELALALEQGDPVPEIARERHGGQSSGPASAVRSPRMKAVILAGGLGTRLSEETTVRPKPMVEIGGKPILWHIMKIYSAHGINDFVICLGYKGYMIKEYFANYYLHTSDVTFDLAQRRDGGAPARAPSRGA